MINCRIRKAEIEKRARKLLVSNKTQYPHVNTINMFTVLTTNGRHGRRKKPLTLKTQFRYKHLVTAQSLLQKKTNKKKKLNRFLLLTLDKCFPQIKESDTFLQLSTWSHVERCVPLDTSSYSLSFTSVVIYSMQKICYI